jgi:hypothetical protein
VLDNIEYEDDFIEASSTSELSDIPEEVEEEFSEEVPKGPPTKISPQLLNGHASLSKVRHTECEPSAPLLLMHHGKLDQ